MFFCFLFFCFFCFFVFFFCFFFLLFLSNQISKPIETKTKPSPKYQIISNPKHQNPLRPKPSNHHLIRDPSIWKRHRSEREIGLREEDLETCTFGYDFEQNREIERVDQSEKERKHHYKSQILNVFLCKTNDFSQWLSLTFIFHAFLSLLISSELIGQKCIDPLWLN